MAYGKADQKSWDSLPGLIRRSNCPDLVDTDVVGRTCPKGYAETDVQRLTT
jgi:hypothetical protein